MIDRITVSEQSSVRASAGKTVYFDPFHIAGEPHDADIIFITHDHYDHFSPDDIAKVTNDGTVFAAPAGMEKQLAKADIADSRVTYLRPGESVTVGGIPTETVPAYNIGKPFHPKSKGWLGYIVTLDGKRVYVCGDTDNTPEAQSAVCDILCVPIGGFYTMNAKSAAELAAAVKPEYVIPTHYGTVVGRPADADEFEKYLGGAVNTVRKIAF